MRPMNQGKNALLVLGLISFLVVGLGWVWPYVAPFLLGLFLAVVFEPVVDGIEKRTRLSRSWSASLVFTLVFVAGTFLFLVGGLRLWEEVRRLLAQWPSYMAQIGSLFARFLPEKRAPQIWLESFFWNSFATGASRGLSFLQDLPGWLGAVVVAFLSAFFFSRDKNLLLQELVGVIPPTWRPAVRQTISSLAGHLTIILRTECLLAGLTFTVTLLWLAVLREPYAWLLATVAGLLELMPVVGPALLFLPWGLVRLLLGQTMKAVSIFSLLLVVAMTRQVLTSKFLAEGSDLHPLAVLVSIYIGYHFFGGAGVIMGPLLAFLAKILWSFLPPDNFHGGVEV